MFVGLDEPQWVKGQNLVAGKTRQKPSDETLALALAGGATLRAAATQAGMSERTAQRRWADPEFRERVSVLRGELIGQASGVLANSMTVAALTLRALLVSDSELVKLHAARAIVSFGIDVRKCVELEAELREIKAALMRMEATKAGGGGQ